MSFGTEGPGTEERGFAISPRCDISLGTQIIGGAAACYFVAFVLGSIVFARQFRKAMALMRGDPSRNFCYNHLFLALCCLLRGAILLTFALFDPNAKCNVDPTEMEVQKLNALQRGVLMDLPGLLVFLVWYHVLFVLMRTCKRQYQQTRKILRLFNFMTAIILLLVLIITMVITTRSFDPSGIDTLVRTTNDYRNAAYMAANAVLALQMVAFMSVAQHISKHIFLCELGTSKRNILSWLLLNCAGIAVQIATVLPLYFDQGAGSDLIETALPVRELWSNAAYYILGEWVPVVGYMVLMRYKEVKVQHDTGSSGGSGGVDDGDLQALLLEGSTGTVDGSLLPSADLICINADELQVEEKVGGGGVGVVHKAMWRGSSVAVKKMGDSYLLLVETQEEIIQEARIWCRLRHPNVLLFLGYTRFHEPHGSALGILGLVTEYMECGSLHDLLYGESPNEAQAVASSASVQAEGAGGSTNSATLPAITWRTLFAVALDTAKGCAYLHGSKVRGARLSMYSHIANVSCLLSSLLLLHQPYLSLPSHYHR
jgi:hypothetical protein